MGLFSILKKLFGGKKFKVSAGSDNLFSDVDTEETVPPPPQQQKKKKKKKSRSYRRHRPRMLSVINENVEKRYGDGKLITRKRNYRRSK